VGPVAVRRVRPDEWKVLREVRLAALAADRAAFASTLEDESEFAEHVWRDRATHGAAGVGTVLFVAEATADGSWVGLAGGLLEEGGDVVELFSMWVDRAGRRQGVAVQLIEAVVQWSLDVGAHTVGLWVAEGNEAAFELYRRCGFEPTGVTGPFPNHPGVTEHRLARAL
jgi:GNAT superfamily N-acetyltransferase